MSESRIEFTPDLAIKLELDLAIYLSLNLNAHDSLNIAEDLYTKLVIWEQQNPNIHLLINKLMNDEWEKLQQTKFTFIDLPEQKEKCREKTYFFAGSNQKLTEEEASQVEKVNERHQFNNQKVITAKTFHSYRDYFFKDGTKLTLSDRKRIYSYGDQNQLFYNGKEVFPVIKNYNPPKKTSRKR